MKGLIYSPLRTPHFALSDRPLARCLAFLPFPSWQRTLDRDGSSRVNDAFSLSCPCLVCQAETDVCFSTAHEIPLAIDQFRFLSIECMLCLLCCMLPLVQDVTANLSASSRPKARLRSCSWLSKQCIQRLRRYISEGTQHAARSLMHTRLCIIDRAITYMLRRKEEKK